MADPPPIKTYSIFAKRPKAAPAPPPAPPANPPSAAPPPSASSTTAAEQPATTLSVPSKIKRTASAVSASSLAGSSRRSTPDITLDSDDDHGAGSSFATLVGSLSGTKKAKKPAAPKQVKGKAKKRTPVVATTDEDSDDDLVIVDSGGETSKGEGKGKRGKKGEPEPSTPKKKKKVGAKKIALPVDETGAIDLTLSPTHSSISSISGFAPLAETYKRERAARAKHEGLQARWPTAEEHGDWVVRRDGPTEAQKWAAGLKRRPMLVKDEKGKGKADEEDDFFAHYHSRILSSPFSSASPTFESRPLDDLPSLVSSLPSHPLLDRLSKPFLDPSSSSSAFSRPGDPAHRPDDLVWAVKYGPQSADEVLGETSQTSARHLRDWLEELKVQTAAEDAKAKKRRRPVNRGLSKPKKKKKKGNGFIASDDDEEEEAYANMSGYYDLDDYPPSDSDDEVAALLGSAASRTPSAVFPTLTNLLLLTGPHGSGKTSTVHAVARELGYEVFEVWPGRGKRRAQDLERYVGDVGKNHVVSGSPRKRPGGAGGDLFSMFKKQGAAKEDGEKWKGKERAEESDEVLGVKGPTQSLILFDEVDVLYAQELDFWQGVVALAKDSRRPIVMTCSDDSQIPFDDLGLQQVQLSSSSSAPLALSLPFAAPPASLAVPYLSLVALLEGHLLPASALTALYESYSPAPPYPSYLCQSQPGERALPHPLSVGYANSRTPDLRRAVVQLQAELQWRGGAEDGSKKKEGETRWQVGGLRVPKSEEEAEGEEDAPPVVAPGAVELDPLERAVLAAEALSAVDALIDRRVRTKLEDLDALPFSTLNPPLQPPTQLPPFPAAESERATQLPFLGREVEMARAARRLAGRVWEASAWRWGEAEEDKLEGKRATFTISLACLTQFQGPDHSLLYPPWAPLLPSPVITTLYRPFLRAITRVEDRAEAALRRRAGLDEDAGSAGEGDGGEAGGGGVKAKVRRSSRRKDAAVEYERKLPWVSKVEADWLRGSGFGSEDEEEQAVAGQHEEEEEE
ncbi:hypothetical protein JCM8097_007769 [Rhodosporidiobolus ruineniae]